MIKAVADGNPREAQRLVDDYGTVDRADWYRLLLLELVECLRSLHDVPDGASVADVAPLIGGSMGGAELRRQVATQHGRELSASDVRAVDESTAPAASIACALLAAYVSVPVGKPAADAFWREAEKIMGDRLTYVSVLIILARSGAEGLISNR